LVVFGYIAKNHLLVYPGPLSISSAAVKKIETASIGLLSVGNNLRFWPFVLKKTGIPKPTFGRPAYRESQPPCLQLTSLRFWFETAAPMNVGLGRTRTLAKLVSDTAKPFGALALLEPAEEQSLLASRPVTDVCGIAARRARKLAEHGIQTAMDFTQADRQLICSFLTVTGEALCGSRTPRR
jgi:hypothetical protein